MQEPVHICIQDMDKEDILVEDYRNGDNNVEVFHVNFPTPDPHTKRSELCLNSLNDGPNVKDEHLILDTIKTNVEKLHRKVNIPPLVLTEVDGIYSTPFQFDRQAPARISTSPTLRRLRKNTIANYTSLQDVFDVSKFPIHKEECIEDNVSCVSQSLEDHLKTDDHLVNPVDRSVHTNYTDDEKSPKHSYNGTTSTVTKGEPEISKIKAFHQSRKYERRRSSVVLSIPGLEVFPGDLLVSDGASDYMYPASWLPNSDAKKPKWPFSKKASFIKGKQKQSYDLESCLSMFKVPDFTEYEFYNIKDKTWDEFRNMQTIENKQITSGSNRKRLESIWELFTSECTYFLEHLLVLKMIFLHALKHLQNNDYLLDVDPVRLFANLEELNQESLNFATSMFHNIKSRELGSASSFSLPLADLLTKYFKDNFCLSHQIYCLNYTSAIIYLETLKQKEDFAAYIKWCEQQEQCRRLHLTDLLVAPLHRLTRYPLLLKNIWRKSNDAAEKVSIYSMKEKVESSIRDLEGRVKWLDKSQKFKQLQDVIVWPSLWERDKRFFIPEGLKHYFKDTNVETILSSPNRQLLYEGRLTLTDSTRLLDVYLLIFDDFLLITKIKRNKRKSSNIEVSTIYTSLHPELQSIMKEGGYCKVLDQPIPLDRLTVKSIDLFHMTVYGMKHAFLIQHENRYQQCIAAFILQANTESAKKMWMSQLETAISCYSEAYESNRSSLFGYPMESAEI
ncbi:pleckstrin homology domain-containing family G member 7 [Hyla sarda]|uniref:pleckstrin homology domain-containing family G member 7 n=1 Tax=Hyla sarda TaxID=327740 RepID=UPI0024C3FE8A|nr:pleckstrin homology domain-containing family G member 7 [Hyla sarda]XP_056425360.1 pleckstrin homology domain-containing family G member 7 [Hyla sarda]